MQLWKSDEKGNVNECFGLFICNIGHERGCTQQSRRQCSTHTAGRPHPGQPCAKSLHQSVFMNHYPQWWCATFRKNNITPISFKYLLFAYTGPAGRAIVIVNTYTHTNPTTWLLCVEHCWSAPHLLSTIVASQLYPVVSNRIQSTAHIIAPAANLKETCFSRGTSI